MRTRLAALVDVFPIGSLLCWAAAVVLALALPR
jgi:hypothetical protein